jgi:hypothetical protein
MRRSKVNWFLPSWKVLFLFLGLLSFHPASALTFNVTYDTSVTSLTNAAQVEAAFAVATQTFQSLYTNKMTVNLTVYFSSSVGLGESSYPLVGNPSYTQLTNALRAARTTAADSNSVASLPAFNPIGSSVWWIPRAEAKALTALSPPYNVSPTNPATDGSVSFASTVSYAFDATNRSVAGKFDFIGVAEHEISEVLGRSFLLNYSLSGYEPNDLFRFTNSGARSLNVNDANVYFSADNGVTGIKFYYGDVNSGDVQDWETYAPADAFDAYLSRGDEATLSAADLTALDVLGYNLNFTPPQLTCTRLGNGNFQLNFTNVTGLNFSILGSSNPTQPASNWSVLGAPTEISSGQYQFTDTSANVVRYYRVRLN